jgi:glucose/mannose-6-phosphate isomerase
MKVDLDNLELLSKLDPSDMLGAINHFPDSLSTQTDQIVAELESPKTDFRNLVLMGMGGSASAGDVVLDWLRNKLEIPSLVHREPLPPSFVDSRTLFVAISYSGETSETLEAFRRARTLSAYLVGVGTGGRLAELCGRFRAPFIEVESAIAPRAALSQLVVAVSTIMGRLGLVQSCSSELRETGHHLLGLRKRFEARASFERNSAKRFASDLLGRSVVLYSLQRMSSVARRFKNQLAENSKQIAKFDTLPEACHNEIEAWRGSADRALPVLIRDGQETAFERSVVEAFRSTIRSASDISAREILIPGRGRLSRLLSPILFLDYVSVYLALLKRVDPTPTKLIAKYKEFRESR